MYFEDKVQTKDGLKCFVLLSSFFLNSARQTTSSIFSHPGRPQHNQKTQQNFVQFKLLWSPFWQSLFCSFKDFCSFANIANAVANTNKLCHLKIGSFPESRSKLAAHLTCSSYALLNARAHLPSITVNFANIVQQQKYYIRVSKCLSFKKTGSRLFHNSYG